MNLSAEILIAKLIAAAAHLKKMFLMMLAPVSATIAAGASMEESDYAALPEWIKRKSSASRCL